MSLCVSCGRLLWNEDEVDSRYKKLPVASLMQAVNHSAELTRHSRRSPPSVSLRD